MSWRMVRTKMDARACTAGLAILAGCADGAAGAEPPPVADRGALALDSMPAARFKFGGPVGHRIAANVEHWLMPAPAANPGMLAMFRLRDRAPEPRPVDWAGEFAGKYLISCVQGLRMSDRADLREHVAAFVSELTAAQAEDGYLGPFPKNRRLLAHWDLWGHYHVLEGLLLWNEHSGDENALRAARRIGDLVCATYLGGSRRVIDAGSPEMNMAISHGLTLLHRRTGEERYLRLVREIERDWERAGDYFRTALAGTEFYQSPKPRWESLHDLQALFELWRLTGEPPYRQAFAHHWQSIARHDVRNTGGFSGGEQATGNPYAPTPIETCCTVAWMAMSVDMLRLTGDVRVADALELAMLNGGLGSQHPSGRWWTYNTPMDGIREASAHSIVFQARAGTPELNCCSVNGPRIPGMLSEWAVMRAGTGLALNWHGPGTVRVPLDGHPIELVCESSYPFNGAVRWRVVSAPPEGVALKWRVPAWCRRANVRTGQTVIAATPGSYAALPRPAFTSDVIECEFDLPLRAVPGERDAAGKVSLYRGPILLACDQLLSGVDEEQIPRIELSRLAEATAVTGGAARDAWLLVTVPAGGSWLTLCDFASAGAGGQRYRSWLIPAP